MRSPTASSTTASSCRKGIVDDRDELGSDLAASLGERDPEDLATLSDVGSARPEDPSPEEAAMHVIEDDGR